MLAMTPEKAPGRAADDSRRVGVGGLRTHLETGVIYCGDNLRLLSDLPTDSVDLAYADPPFFSNRQYEVIWGDEAEVRSFEDRWQGGVHVYVAWMRERVLEIQRVLKLTGSFYLHCDWHAAHYLRPMLDEVFGANRFQNEIIWYYRGGGVSPRRWARRHDTIFFYTKGGTWTFNVDPVRTPYSEDSAERLRYKARAFRDNRVYDTYEQNPLGKHPDDVWEVQPIMPSAKERLGYPTQKPLRLMDRIIAASSNKGDVVLDPFCGCGTTLVSAQQLGREWIGMDISPTAVELMSRRLQQLGVRPKLVGIPVSEEQLRALKPFEFQNWVIQKYNGTHSPRHTGDMGIDGYSWFEHLPIQVKQSDAVGRNTVDNFETAVERGGKQGGYIVAFSFTKGAYEEAARAKSQKGVAIDLVKVADLLTGQAAPSGPPSGLLEPEIVLTPPRPPEALPSVEELVASEKAAQGPVAT